MDAEGRIEIISAFGAHLETRKSAFERESKLPYPKEVIRQAMAEELASPTDPKLIDAMESGFLLLEDFVTDEDYFVVQRYERVLAERGQVLNAEGAAFKNFVREAANASEPMLTIMDRCLSQKTARMQQLLKMRALRQPKNGLHDSIALKARLDGNTSTQFRHAAQRNANATWLYLIIAGIVWYFADWVWALIPLALATYGAFQSVSATHVAVKLEKYEKTTQ